MSPTLALILSVSFILVVYMRDAKRTQDASAALWVPLIWLMIIASRPVSYWFLGRSVVSADDVLSGSPFDRAVLSVLIAAGSCILLRRKIDWPRLLRNNYLIFLWILYGAISILWSDFSGVSFKRWTKEIGTVIMVLIVATEPAPVEAVKILLRRCAYALIPLSILAIKYFREAGVSYSPWGGSAVMVGLTTDKNALGRLCLICGFFLFWSLVLIWRNKKQPFRFSELAVQGAFLIMTLALLAMANSATSAATLLIGILVFSALGTGFFKRNARYLGFFIVLALFAFLLFEWTLNITENMVTMMGRDMTLTGRTDLWKDLLALGASPVFGAGYDSFWLGDRLEKLWGKYWWLPNEAHNGYLEVYLNLGLIGLLLLTGILISTYKKIQKTLTVDSDYGRFKMAFFIMILSYNITEAAFRGMAFMWLMFLLIAVDNPRRSPQPISGPFGERAAPRNVKLRVRSSE